MEVSPPDSRSLTFSDWQRLTRLDSGPQSPSPNAVLTDPGPLSPGDRVLLKQLHPKPLQPGWTEPYTVILTNPSAAKLLGHPAWYHLTHLKKLPSTTSTKTWQVTQMGPTSLQISRVGDAINADPSPFPNPV
uniref:Murine leukemia virus integrase C-terminal domain-containing protein n=1 Tax=Castor canadensis TaxID=51338 RepID=A0A8C0XMV4_CASCN